MHLSARQVPDQPSFHRAKQELPFISQLPHSWNVIKNPLNFCCREVGVDNQARFLPHVRLQALIFELCAIIRSAAALPNDRVISWLSGGFIPEDRRLALVGDANCSDLPGIHLPGDYILIDCMPSLGMMTVNALVAADSVIIPSQPNFLSTKGLNLLLRSISKIKRQLNPRLKIDGILLTMVDNRTNNAKAIISSLRSTVGENIRVFRSEIPFSVRAAECSLSGESIFSHDRNGKVAAAYEALTKEVTEIEERTKNRSGPDRVR